MALCKWLHGYSFAPMKPLTDPRLKTDETDGPIARGYAAWKRAKVERGLAQAQDRGAMIPVEQILADLKSELANRNLARSPPKRNISALHTGSDTKSLILPASCR